MSRKFHMTKIKGAVLASALLGVALVGVTALPSAANHSPDITVEVLSGPRAVFTDDVDLKLKIKRPGEDAIVSNTKDPSRTVVARITVAPGEHFDWHTHPGPVIVNVAQGELVYLGAEDCVERSYPAGTAFVDPGHEHVHTAFNPSSTTATVLLATFFEAPAAGPLLIAAPEPDDCEV
jgi:quercetin dioxygenase-like cupin family protein